MIEHPKVRNWSSHVPTKRNEDTQTKWIKNSRLFTQYNLIMLETRIKCKKEKKGDPSRQGSLPYKGRWRVVFVGSFPLAFFCKKICSIPQYPWSSSHKTSKTKAKCIITVGVKIPILKGDQIHGIKGRKTEKEKRLKAIRTYIAWNTDRIRIWNRNVKVEVGIF